MLIELVDLLPVHQYSVGICFIFRSFESLLQCTLLPKLVFISLPINSEFSLTFQLKCCGVTGGINSTTSWALYRMSEWYKGLATGL